MKRTTKLILAAGVVLLAGLEVASTGNAERVPPSTPGNDGPIVSPASRSGDDPPKGWHDCPGGYQLLTSAGGDTRVRVSIHVFDEGVTPQRINDQIGVMQTRFSGGNIHLDVDYEIIEDGDYRSLSSETQVSNMMSDHADHPDTRLNIYVTDIQTTLKTSGSSASQAGASDVQRGIVIDGDAFGSNHTTVVQEMARCLGLPHLQSGRGDR